MASDPKLLFRYANLTREDREAMFDAARKNDPVLRVDESALDGILAKVADARLDFAERRASFAGALLESTPGDEEMAQREAIVAAYDAIHHALRALNVGFVGWDPIEHEATLEAAGTLGDENRELRKRFDTLGLGRPLQDSVADLRTVRQAAEWDVTNRDEDGNARVDYPMHASGAVKLAGDAVRVVRAALYDHRAGSL